MQAVSLSVQDYKPLVLLTLVLRGMFRFSESVNSTVENDKQAFTMVGNRPEHMTNV